MKRLLAVLMIVAILVSCTSPALAKKGKRRTKGRNQPTKREQSVEWFSEATLLDKEIADWKKATREQKVATCGAIIFAADLKGALALKPSMQTLKGYAEILANAVDEGINGNSNNRDVLRLKVMDVAVMGMAYLGWLK